MSTLIKKINSASKYSIPYLNQYYKINDIPQPQVFFFLKVIYSWIYFLKVIYTDVINNTVPQQNFFDRRNKTIKQSREN